MESRQKGIDWQVGIWDTMSQVYQHEIDKRFAPLIQSQIEKAEIKKNMQVLDLGCGTASIAAIASGLVGENGKVVGVDISNKMLEVAQKRMQLAGIKNVDFLLGTAEKIPLIDNSIDVIIASLSLMFVIDRKSAAKEIARVLKPGGRFIATTWTGGEQCDLSHFQEILGSFAPLPPIENVGIAALADPSPFMVELLNEGIESTLELETVLFDFENFEEAWSIFAKVTANKLNSESKIQAQKALMDILWPNGNGYKQFRNHANIILGKKL